MPNIESDMRKRAKVQELGAPVYLFTNENIAEYLSCIHNIHNARVLTVAASGDHAFHAYMMGASYVDTFDFNIYQQSVMDLKLEMIHRLSYEDFRNFFEKKIKYKDFDLTDDFFATLSDSAKKILHAIDVHGTSMIREDGTFPRYGGQYVTDKQKYDQLKSVLPEHINFTHTDIYQLSQHFNQKYDVILLSNIFAYLYPAGQNFESLMKMYNDILMPLAQNNLTDNGQICLHYNWGFEYMTSPTVYWENAIKRANEQIHINNHQFELQYIDSFKRGCYTDAVTIMKKIHTRTR